MKTLNRQILHLALPNIVSNLSVPLLSAVDTALVGHLPNSWSIGAVAVGGMIFNFVYWGFGFLRMGTTGLAAQAFGQKDKRASSLVLSRTVLVALAAAVLLLLFQNVIAKIAFFLVDASPQVELFAKKYFFIRIFAAPATLSLYALIGWFLGMQNARFPMIISIVINLLNVALDAWFVLGMHMDADGVAWGTLIAQYTGLVLALFFLWKYYRSHIHRFGLTEILHRGELLQLFKLNGDIFIRTLFLIFVFSFFTAKSASFGDEILAANAILIQLWMIFSYGIDGFAYAAESLVGRYIGAGNRGQLRLLIRLLFKWGAGLGLIFSLTYFLLGKPILSLFTNQETVFTLAVSYLGWTIAAPAVNSFCYIWDGIYIGATASAAMRNSMILATLGFFLPVYYIGHQLWGNHGMWLAMLLFMAARGVSLTLLAGKNVFEERGLMNEKKK